MEKTIQLMKESGLFDSLVKNIHEKDMSIDAVALALDNVCAVDENFEDTFFNDMHKLAMDIIWGELMTTVNCLPTIPTKGEQKRETKHEVNFEDLEKDLMKMTMDITMRKFSGLIEDLIDKALADAMKNNK